MGECAWRLQNAVAGVAIKEADSATETPLGAAAEVVRYVNSLSQTELRLYTESEVVRLGASFSPEEGLMRSQCCDVCEVMRGCDCPSACSAGLSDHLMFPLDTGEPELFTVSHPALCARP